MRSLYTVIISIFFLCQLKGQQAIHGIQISRDSITIGDEIDLIYKLQTTNPDLIRSLRFSTFDSLKSLSDEMNYDSLEYYGELDWNGRFTDNRNKIIQLDQSIFAFNGKNYLYIDTFKVNFWDIGIYQLVLPEIEFSNSESEIDVQALQSPMILVNIPEDVVNTDTTSVILPIKDILQEGKNFSDYLWILYVLVLLLFIGLIYFIVFNRKNKREIIIPEPVKLPAHFIALKQLAELKSQALWQAGKVKEHQSSLTHIIREYLENRFDIKALESTTDQIVKALKSKNFNANHESDLKEILEIADLVKFAKAKPPIDINALFLEKAVAFVEQSKVNLSRVEEEEIFQAKKKYDDAISKLKKKSALIFLIPFGDFEFQHPWFLLLLLLLPLIWYWKYKMTSHKNSNMTFPHVGSIKDVISIKALLVTYLPLLRYLGLAALIFALARPRLVLKEEEVKAEGIDIIMVMDLSSSMLARDFNPDRLTVSKEMAKKFIDKRPYDRIGLVVFAGESFTQSPLTTDHRIVKEFLSSLESGMLEDGTAIGMGLASAVNRLETSTSKSKIVILLTDGVNNAGYIKPMTAAEIAKEIEVKVYTIGVGSMGEAISPVSRRSDGRYIFGVSRVEIDEELLTEISKLTGGQYFRATNEQGLEAIYSEIDQLEKTEIEVSVFKRYSEEFRTFLFFGLIFIALEWLLKNSILRTIP